MNLPKPPDLGRATDRVLLVDDDPVARLLTASILGQHGFSVIEAGGGREALDRFTPAVNCVLLDALMPGMDGFATCKALRNLPGGGQVPVLMLTGLDDEDSIARAYEAGATDFFVKSSQWTLLAQRTRYLLRASRTRQELEHSRASLARAQRIAKLGTWEWDPRADTIVASDICAEMFGAPHGPGPLAAGRFFDAVHCADQARLHAMLARLVSQPGPQEIGIRIGTADDHWIHVHIEADAVHDAAGTMNLITGTSQDITQRKEAEEQIRALADYDSLTALPNRRLFRERFASAIEDAARRKTRLAALFVDLDRFKQINDTQGHSAGDILLRETATRLLRCVRSGEGETDMVARVGGDEFIILLTDVDEVTHVQKVADRVLAVMRKPFTIGGRENFISASVGIARYPEDGADSESLLRNADAAMYSVKGQGRNNVAAYKPELNVTDRKRWELEQALYKAIERDELVLHYQPQVDVKTGRIPGVEALMRWNHGGRMISPADFIPIAEETGLIVAFGEWALATGAAQAAAWIAQGLPPVRVAVNIPGSHFQRPGFVDMVRRVLEAARLPGYLLELEITETMLMTDLGTTLATLKALNDLDIRLAIDDFGTGYSSLSYLRRFDVDQLKIDRSFVMDMQPDNDNEAITAAIIAMATALKLEVVAEGVETRDQMMMLYKRGCTMMQGYYFSRPAAAAQVTELLAALERDGPRADWRLAEAGRVITLLPGFKVAQAA